MEKLRIGHRAWVLVADGTKALFLRNDGDEVHPNLKVIDVEQQPSLATREQGTDRPGRNNRGRPSNNRSAMESTDLHQLAEDQFAKGVADTMNDAALSNRFEELIVVAPPRVLAELRARFHKETQGRIIAEIDKTLTGHPVWDIEKLLSGR